MRISEFRFEGDDEFYFAKSDHDHTPRPTRPDPPRSNMYDEYITKREADLFFSDSAELADYEAAEFNKSFVEQDGRTPGQVRYDALLKFYEDNSELLAEYGEAVGASGGWSDASSQPIEKSMTDAVADYKGDTVAGLIEKAIGNEARRRQLQHENRGKSETELFFEIADRDEIGKRLYSQRVVHGDMFLDEVPMLKSIAGKSELTECVELAKRWAR